MITPFKKCTAENISQTFHEKHRALDLYKRGLFSGYGVALCAPEDVEITSVKSIENSDLEIGYGVKMRGIDSGFTHVYWHTLPIVIAEEGEVYKKGDIIAFMGNSGYVHTGGKYVPLDERLEPPYKGTHVHWEITAKNNKPVNPLFYITWEQPQYTKRDLIKSHLKVMKKMGAYLLKKSNK